MYKQVNEVLKDVLIGTGKSNEERLKLVKDHKIELSGVSDSDFYELESTVATEDEVLQMKTDRLPIPKVVALSYFKADGTSKRNSNRNLNLERHANEYNVILDVARNVSKLTPILTPKGDVPLGLKEGSFVLVTIQNTPSIYTSSEIVDCHYSIPFKDNNTLFEGTLSFFEDGIPIHKLVTPIAKKDQFGIPKSQSDVPEADKGKDSVSLANITMTFLIRLGLGTTSRQCTQEVLAGVAAEYENMKELKSMFTVEAYHSVSHMLLIKPPPPELVEDAEKRIIATLSGKPHVVITKGINKNIK